MIKLLLPLALLIGCTSMKPGYKFCSKTDWKDLGRKDALNNENSLKKITQYRNTCSVFDGDYSPNKTTYNFGFSVGVKEFCQFDTGLDFGQRGKKILFNCKRKTHSDFFEGLSKGYNDYCSFDNGFKVGINGIVTSNICKRKEHRSFYKGISKGKSKYCSYQVGVLMGTSSKQYTGICNGHAEESFMRGYTVGENKKELKLLRGEVSDLKSQNYTLQDNLNRLQNELNRSNNKNNALESQVNSLRRQLKIQTN
jgi:hypothetical protein